MVEYLNKDLSPTAAVVHLINEIEKNFPVDEWMINGVKVWPMIRIDLFFELEIFSKKHSQDCFGRRRYFCSLITMFSTLIWNLFKFKRDACGKVGVFILSYTTSRVNYGGIWYNIFFDQINQYLLSNEISYYCMEAGIRKSQKNDRYNGLKNIQAALYWMRLKSKLYSKEHLVVQLSGFDAVVKFVQNRKFVLPRILNTSILISRALYVILVSSYFQKRLSKLRPSTAFCECYYSCEGQALNLACKKLGLVTVDIQHGVQGRYHIAYGSWHKVPSNGYDLLPNIFWVWSDFEVKNIEAWSRNVNGHEVIIGGNVLLKMMTSDYSFIAFYENKIKHYLDRYNNYKFILLTLGDRDDYGLGELVLELMKKTEVSCFWFVRSHPAALKDNVCKIFIENTLLKNHVFNVETNFATEIPLHVLLKYMDLHVTNCSTVVLEAEYFGTTSIVLDETAKFYYAEQIKSGIAIFENDVNNLLNLIMSCNKENRAISKELGLKNERYFFSALQKIMVMKN